MARILIVEDDPLIRVGMARLLTKAGHDVRTVADGEAALREAAVLVPDLVLLDVGLPGLDGVSCAERLRQQRFRGSVVFLTADDHEDTVRRATAAAAHAYLVKPITGAQLLPVVSTALAAAVRGEAEQVRMEDALRDSRTISAAVGVLAERHACNIDEAFERLRHQARKEGRKIVELAAEIAPTPSPGGRARR
ncbi:MAG: response regulator [Burkholderiaceae bacterium]|nr:response regulator [Burkholderiaceae bacterium]